MTRFEGHFLPVEKPEGRTRLQQRLERQQIAFLQTLMTPRDEWGLGVELTSGARLVMWAMEDLDYLTGVSKYRWRLMMRWIPPQKIWTPRMQRYFGQGRDMGLATAVTPHSGPDTAAETADEIQKRVEGEVITGAAPTYEANQDGGERVMIEFRGGGKLQIDALPPLPGDRTCRADLGLRWIAPPERTHIWLPGTGTAPRS